MLRRPRPVRPPVREGLAERHRSRLDAFSTLSLNFDPDDFDPEADAEHHQAQGWNVDRHRTDLPVEAPGPPQPGGSFEAACGVLRRYDFPDPKIVTGVYLPDGPLEGRNLLLQARFLFLKFYFGVRVARVLDEQREHPEFGPADVWGFAYQTLEGHWEQGEMTFTIWKFRETGAVQFHIDAFSRTGEIPNPFYRLGFKLFGRKIQLRFAHRALYRMRALVDAQLKRRPAEVQEGPEVQSKQEDGKMGG